MRVVLDTNVVASAIFFGGVPGKILSAYFERSFDLVLTPPIADEYAATCSKLGKKVHFNESEKIIDKIIRQAILVQDCAVPVPECEDPDDVMFLEAAIIADAKYIVSGDKHLLDIRRFADIQILKARPFLDLL